MGRNGPEVLSATRIEDTVDIIPRTDEHHDEGRVSLRKQSGLQMEKRTKGVREKETTDAANNSVVGV